MSKWNDDKELFKLMKEKLYTPVVGDILIPWDITPVPASGDHAVKR